MSCGEYEVFFKVYGEECFNEEEALSQLLHDGVLFCNYYDARHPLYPDADSNRTVVLFVNCNDLFEYGADSEELSSKEELLSLYKLCNENGYGLEKWVALKRQYRPRPDVEQRMKEDGCWDEELEKLSR